MFCILAIMIAGGAGRILSSLAVFFALQGMATDPAGASSPAGLPVGALVDGASPWFASPSPLLRGVSPLLPGVSPLLQDGPPIEKQIKRATMDALNGIRRTVRRFFYMQKFGPSWWWRKVRRAVPPIAFALLMLLADPALFRAWKREGLMVFATYACLTLYVYSRLLLSSQVGFAPRLFLLGALVYGVWRGDLIPDRYLTHVIPGRLDDFLLIGIATRTFVAACPEDLVKRYADRAVLLWRRVSSLRGGGRGGRTEQAA